MAAVKALQQWCKIQCDGYRDVSITNMTTSFRDGLAFCALIHKHRPDLINFDKLSKENVYENNKLAFRVAEEELGIPALLDAEDMVALRVPDRLSILTYVSQYYNYFHGRSPIGGMAGVKRPAEEPAVSVAEAKRPADVPAVSVPGKKNQPVTAKVYGSPKTDPEPKSKILVERTNRPGTLSSNCTICNNHVHLVQRHLVDGKLYHRNCFRCRECSTILLSGTYKPGKEPNTFICKSHQDTPKSPTTRTPQVTVLTRDTQPRSTQTQKPPTPQARVLTRDAQPQPAQTQKPPTPQTRVLTQDAQPQPAQTHKPPTPQTRVLTWVTQPQPTQPTLKSLVSPGKEPTLSKPSSLGVVNKTASPFAPTLAKATMPTSEAKADQKVWTETPKAPSSTVQKTQEARQRFFEGSSSPASTTPVTKPASVSPANEKQTTGTGDGTGTANGRVQVQVGNWAKENKEKQNDDEKQRAKNVISKLMIEETNKSSSPLGTNVISNKTSPRDVGSKGHTRVLLKPRITDVELGVNKTAGGHEAKDKNSASISHSASVGENEHSHWRARLKPVNKDTNPASSKDTTPAGNLKTSGTSPQPSEPGSKSWLLSPSTTSVSTSKSSSKSPTTTLREESTAAPGGKAGDRYKNPEVGNKSSSNSTTAVKPQKFQKKPDYIPQEEILKELKEIEVSLDELEKQGVELEKRLRACEDDGEEDVLANDLMVEWFNLIRSKQMYIRRESELVYIGRSQDLEEEQPNVEAELRRLMEKPDHLKTSRDRKREEELMAKLVEIVNDRNAIVDGLDEDRLREEEEDEQLNKMMQNLDTKKEKKKKSSFSKFFGW